MFVISEETLLLRRYYTPFSKYMNPDGTPTSRVFKPREKDQGKLSVDLKNYTTYEKSVLDPSKFFMCEVSNKVVLEIGLETIHDPLEDGTNDAHALILTFELDDEIKPGLLARKARIIRSKEEF